MPNFRLSALWLLLLCELPLMAQTPKPAHKSVAKSDDLGRPIEWGTFSARFFTDDDTKIDFTLHTSWIPGEEHKGMFRYRVSAIVNKAQREANSTRYTADAVEAFVRRVQACSVVMTLLDSDQFVIREIDLPLVFGIHSDNARVFALSANAAEQMDAKEYRSFVGSGDKSGGWSVSPNCEKY